MTRPFDATTRQLIELAPAEWLEYLGRPVADPSQVNVVDSNLSTVAAEADKVVRVEGPTPWIELIELQAGRDARLDRRSHYYSTLLEHRHQVPVRTSLVLLRPAADGPELTGKLELRHVDGAVYDTFLYHVVRVWQQPVETALSCGLTVLPLAPVSRVAVGEVRAILLAISKRLEREATPEQAAALWSATKILLGLRYDQAQVDAIVREVSAMLYGIRGIEESSVYQGILRKGMTEGRAQGMTQGMAQGHVEEARQNLLDLGRAKLGPPDGRFEAEIAAESDLSRLHTLLRRLLVVSTWEALFATDDPIVGA